MAEIKFDLTDAQRNVLIGIRDGAHLSATFIPNTVTSLVNKRLVRKSGAFVYLTSFGQSVARELGDDMIWEETEDW